MVGYVLVFLLGVVFGGVGVAFFCMAADMSSVRPSGEVIDLTGMRGVYVNKLADGVTNSPEPGGLPSADPRTIVVVHRHEDGRL